MAYRCPTCGVLIFYPRRGCCRCDGLAETYAMHDRYLNVDDPRDPPAETQAPPGGATGTAGPLDRDPPQEGPAESETDRCLRVMREVFLGQPGPHDLPSGVAEVERRLREGAR